MDPEDVLDFGEDGKRSLSPLSVFFFHDGLDVISLGASDHDGRPVSNRSSSTTVESTSRSIRQPRATSPCHSRHHKSTSNTQPSDRHRHGSVYRTADSTRAPPYERHHRHISRPADRIVPHPDRRLLVEDACRHAERTSITAPIRSRPSLDRPRPGERASYMPPDRLQAISASSRTSNTPNPKADSNRPIASLSTRITDRQDADQKPIPGRRDAAQKPLPSRRDDVQKLNPDRRDTQQKPIPDRRDVDQKPVPDGRDTNQNSMPDRRDQDQKPANPLSPSKPSTEREKFAEAPDAKKPVEPSVDPASTELPEGWISRISKGSKKTYYVNAFTRTSQWNRPTEPASGKPTKTTHKVAKQPAQEIIETPTHQAQRDQPKSNVVDSARDAATVSKSQKAGPDLQAGNHSQPLDNSPLNLRPSSQAAVHDGHQLATPREPLRHHDISKPLVDRYQRPPDLMGSRIAHAPDSDIDGRAIPQERIQPDPREPYSRDHRIHPDRRQEIASAKSHRGRVSAPEPPKAISTGSFHRDTPPHSEISNRDRPRYVVPARYSHESDFLRSVGNHRPRSISPGPRLVPSHRIPKRDRRERRSSKLTSTCFDGVVQQCFSQSLNPDQSLSIIRKAVPLSGANGIPKAPGRSFPDPIGPSQSHEMYINPETSRYNKPPSIPPKLPEPPDYRDNDWRRRTDHPHDRDMSPQDRRPSSWSRQEVCPISPIYSSHRHPLVVRPRSPSPPPRRMPAAMPGVSRAPVQHDLYPAERVRPPPVSSRMSLEHRPIHSPEPSDLMRRSAASRYDAYRPSTSLTSESCGARPHDSRRSDAYYPRDPGPPRSEFSHEEVRRSHVVQHLPILPEPPKTYQDASQPDLYRPPPRPAHAPRVSPRRTEPPKYYPIIDLDEISNKPEPPPGPPTFKNAHVPPQPAYPTVQASRPPLNEQSDRPQDYNGSKLPSFNLRGSPAINTKAAITDMVQKHPTDDGGNTPSHDVSKTPSSSASEPSIDGARRISIDDASRAMMDTPDEPTRGTLGTPTRNDRNRNGRRGRSIEPEDVGDNYPNASSDIVEIPPPQLAKPDADPQKQPVSLAKRLGPVADCSLESNKLSPPAKRSRPNPVDRMEGPDVTNNQAHSPTISPPLPEETSPSKKTVSSTSPPDSSEMIQSQLAVPDRPAKLETMTQTRPPATTSQEKVISLRGRAGRKFENTELAEQQRPQVVGKVVDETIPPPTGNGSLRDRIQDLNFSPVAPAQSRPSTHRVSPNETQPRSADRPPDVHYGHSRAHQGPPPGRHISERISAFRAPSDHSPSSNDNHRSRYAPRQSDSGWSGRKARYS
ncbi:hypothetical protein VP01_536g2 [Puccinia sorghi]|uniref:WW domain-containing protein n=1 Tax=Puccinia sorghi TaxID=27349 RepID=A0A0L6UK21_9BASI|nr:hypothetical protein VP01_536g2 [Puccinia sorghi]